MLDPYNGFKCAASVSHNVQPETGPGDREPRLARRSPFALSVKLCPRCLNPLEAKMLSLAGYLPMEYQCPKCGYYGTMYLEKDPDSEPEKR